MLIDDFLNGDVAPDLISKRSLESLALLIGQRFGHVRSPRFGSLRRRVT